MAKYNSYIELSPHYESVVDIDSESRHPDMWQEYIVHEDMKGAIEKICDSMKYEDENQRRSFWIRGAYGTGKSYAAIVLKHQLKGICDVTINVADFCRAPDTVPQFDQIKNKLKECEGQQVLLLSVGEYLRLCTKRELNPDRRQFRAFWETQQPEASKTRVIIPVFNCRDIFDRIIGAIDERQENYVWTLDSEPSVENYTVSVYSPKFKDAINPDADNLTSWFQDWQIILRRNVPCSVVTMQYGNVETAYGTVNIKPIDSPFRYLTDILVDGNLLVEKWQSNDFWSRVVNFTSQYAAKTASFDKVVLDALNVNEFDFVSVAARWETLNDFQKNLVWLWYRVYPTDGYYSYACKKASCASEIPEKIRDEILLISNRSDRWIEERMAAVRALSFHSFDDSYFALMDKLPLDETKLKLLTYQTHEEKTYVYQKISKRGWLISGGTVSRASLIYDNQKKTGGLLTRFDFVGFDEIQSMTFDKPSQIQTALKDYMEFGEVQGFDAQIVADAGVIVLGNINASRFNVNENMMEEVSSVFSESASLDRFHGFIPGWKIPRMHQGLVANGWALNTEYFAEVLHLLRDDLTYTTIVDECLAVPAKPDKRDLTAIKRLCTAFVKLLYPNATCKDDIPADEFIKYCLEPAKEMRGVIKKQLCIIDPKEFNVPGKKDIPDIQYNYM